MFILYGGCAASQLWCYKISFRLWSRYRPVYGTTRGNKTPTASDAADSSQISNGKAKGTPNGGVTTPNGAAGMPENGTGNASSGIKKYE